MISDWPAASVMGVRTQVAEGFLQSSRACGQFRPLTGPARRTISVHKVQRALIVEQRQISKDVALHFLRLGLVVNPLQFGNYLTHGALAVAALNYFQTRPEQSQRLFRH